MLGRKQSHPRSLSKPLQLYQELGLSQGVYWFRHIIMVRSFIDWEWDGEDKELSRLAGKINKKISNR
jgi:hypothetical protein